LSDAGTLSERITAATRALYELRARSNHPAMTIPVAGVDPSNPYAIAVQKLAQNQAKQEGEQAVALIQNSAPPVGPNGEGSHINTYG
jgi:hypothetical protein